MSKYILIIYTNRLIPTTLITLDEMLLGEKLKLAIEESGIPIKKVAPLIGMSEQNLHRLFKRDSMETRYLTDICQVINRDPKEFFDSFSVDNSRNIVSGVAGNKLKGGVNTINNRTSGGYNERECQYQLQILQLKLEIAQKEVEDLRTKLANQT